MQGKDTIPSGDSDAMATVGPGAYDCTSATDRRGPAYSIPAAPRYLGDTEPSTAEDSGPAVGDYDVTVLSNTPAYSIPRAGIDDSTQPGYVGAAVGPGEYLGVGVAGEGGPAFTIPRAGTSEKVPDGFPGPADYRADSDAVGKQAPAFTIGLRCAAQHHSHFVNALALRFEHITRPLFSLLSFCFISQTAIGRFEPYSATVMGILLVLDGAILVCWVYFGGMTDSEKIPQDLPSPLSHAARYEKKEMIPQHSQGPRTTVHQLRRKGPPFQSHCGCHKILRVTLLMFLE